MVVNRFVIGASLGLLVGLASVTASRVEVWQSNATLWADAVSVTPARPRPLLNLARVRLAAAETRTEIDAALALTARARAATEAPHRSARRAEFQLIADVLRATGLAAIQDRPAARSLIASVLARDPEFPPARAMAAWLW